MGEGASYLLNLALELTLQSMQIVSMLRDLVSLLSYLVRKRFDSSPQILDLFIFGPDELLVGLKLRLELHDKLAALLQSGLVASAFCFLALVNGLHLGNLGLSFLKLARLFGQLELFLSLGLLQLVELTLQVFTFVLSSV